MKLEPDSPNRVRGLLLILGVAGVYMGIDDLSSDTVNIGRRGRQFFEVLNGIFGTIHSDDYFSIFGGICLIYYGLFKFKSSNSL